MMVNTEALTGKLKTIMIAMPYGQTMKRETTAINVYDRIGENGYTTYTVEGWDEGEYESRVREDVPREILEMIDKPYSTDWHKQGGFRHHIGIPDEMMPDSWRNNMTNV
jgi:hypothetical protein